MPYIEKILDHVSDFGWEIGSAEYEIDMISDDEPDDLLYQEEQEINVSFMAQEMLLYRKLTNKQKRFLRRFI